MRHCKDLSPFFAKGLSDLIFMVIHLIYILCTMSLYLPIPLLFLPSPEGPGGRGISGENNLESHNHQGLSVIADVWWREAYFDEGGKLFKKGTWFMQWVGDREACEVTTSSHRQFHNLIVTFLMVKLLKPLWHDSWPNTMISHHLPLSVFCVDGTLCAVHESHWHSF